MVYRPTRICISSRANTLKNSIKFFLTLCHDSELNPQLSPTFKELLNNLRNYNMT